MDLTGFYDKVPIQNSPSITRSLIPCILLLLLYSRAIRRVARQNGRSIVKYGTRSEASGTLAQSAYVCIALYVGVS